MLILRSFVWASFNSASLQKQAAFSVIPHFHCSVERGSAFFEILETKFNAIISLWMHLPRGEMEEEISMMIAFNWLQGFLTMIINDILFLVIHFARYRGHFSSAPFTGRSKVEKCLHTANHSKLSLQRLKRNYQSAESTTSNATALTVKIPRSTR